MSFSDIESFTAVQHNVLSFAQAIEVLGESRARNAIRSGRLVRVHRGVYRVAGICLSRHGELMAAALAAGPNARVSHLAAFELYRLIPFRPGAAVHVTAPYGQSGSVAGLVIHRSSSALGASHVANIAVTGLSRSFVDNARAISEHYLGGLLDAATVQHGLSAEEVEAALVDAGKRPGNRKLRRILESRLELGDPTTIMSVLEARFARTIKALGLPQPSRQFPVGPYKLDAAWPDLLLSVELDGHKAHGRSRKQMEHDMQRGNYLTTRQWIQYRFGYRDGEQRMAEILSPHFA